MGSKEGLQWVFLQSACSRHLPSVEREQTKGGYWKSIPPRIFAVTETTARDAATNHGGRQWREATARDHGERPRRETMARDHGKRPRPETTAADLGQRSRRNGSEGKCFRNIRNKGEPHSPNRPRCQYRGQRERVVFAVSQVFAVNVVKPCPLAEEPAPL